MYYLGIYPLKIPQYRAPSYNWHAEQLILSLVYLSSATLSAAVAAQKQPIQLFTLQRKTAKKTNLNKQNTPCKLRAVGENVRVRIVH